MLWLSHYLESRNNEEGRRAKLLLPNLKPTTDFDKHSVSISVFTLYFPSAAMVRDNGVCICPNDVIMRRVCPFHVMSKELMASPQD